jgi:HK97 family phage major capsid protein
MIKELRKQRKEIQEKRVAIHSKMQAILDTANGEKRKTNAEEDQTWNDFDLELSQLNNSVSDIDKNIDAYLEEIEEEENRTINNKQTKKGMLVERMPRINEESAAAWIDTRSGEKINVLSNTQRISDITPSELSLGKAIRSIISGSWANAPEEQRALSGSTGTAGAILVPQELSASIIDRARAKSVVIGSGAQTILMASNNLTIAKVSSDPSFQWKAENASFTSNDIGFTPVNLKAYTLGTIVTLSRELAADSVNAVQAIEDILVNSIAAMMDQAALSGTGTNQPLGISNQAGIGSVTVTSALQNYTPIVAAWTNVIGSNFSPNTLVTGTREAGKMAGFVDTTGQPLQAPKVIGDLNHMYTSAIPSTGTTYALLGDFSQVLLGMRQNFEIEVTQVAGDTFGNHQVAIKIVARMDVALQHAGAICKVSGFIA